MNAKQRNANRQTAEALHYANQNPAPKFGKVTLKPFQPKPAKG